MKPPGKPVSQEGVLRPAFPVRLKSEAGFPDAPKSVASSAHITGAKALFPSAIVSKTPVLTTPGSALKPPRQAVAPLGVGMVSGAIRARMVDRLAAQGLRDERVLAAMRQVERHRFVDTALATQAYEDTSLPIGLGQTISKPNVVARMLELLMQGHAGKLGRVLEIGTGCGYQAALLGQLAHEVYSIERLRGLHQKARDNLRPFRLPNVHLLFGDGMHAYAKGAPYAAIIAAAGGEAIPSAWVEQLAVGGRLVAPLQTARGAQALVMIEKTPGGVRQSVLEAVHFVPLKSGTE